MGGGKSVVFLHTLPKPLKIHQNDIYAINNCIARKRSTKKDRQIAHSKRFEFSVYSKNSTLNLGRLFTITD